MTITKTKRDWTPDFECRVFLRASIEQYFEDHPMAFMEARKMMGSHSLAKRVAFRVFPE